MYIILTGLQGKAKRWEQKFKGKVLIALTKYGCFCCKTMFSTNTKLFLKEIKTMQLVFFPCIEILCTPC